MTSMCFEETYMYLVCALWTFRFNEQPFWINSYATVFFTSVDNVHKTGKLRRDPSLSWRDGFLLSPSNVCVCIHLLIAEWSKSSIGNRMFRILEISQFYQNIYYHSIAVIIYENHKTNQVLKIHNLQNWLKSRKLFVYLQNVLFSEKRFYTKLHRKFGSTSADITEKE